ncbi:MAG: hypothetical protein HGA80_03565 [Candidatus Omnitrophica bacterium]|nr:hypothetical protein [Candidatus Omnitrophota bacterium]
MTTAAASRLRAWYGPAAALALALIFGASLWSRVDFSERILPGGDTCVYMLLARSLKDHGDLRSTWSVGERPHGQLAPGFPALLVPFLTDSGLDVPAVRALIVTLAAASIFLVFLLFRPAGDITALAVAFMSGVNGLIFLYGRSILSEIPYLFLSLLALLFWEGYERYQRRSLTLEVLLSVTLAAAFLMRSMGIFLIGAVFLRMALDQEAGGLRALCRRPFLFWAVSSVVALWLVRQLVVFQISHQSYGYEFLAGDEGKGAGVLQFSMRWLRGIYAFVFYAISQALSNIRFSGRSAGAFLLSAVCLFGLGRELVLRRRVMDIYVAGYLFVAASWPWVQTSGARYVTPFVPFLLYYFWHGLGELVALAAASFWRQAVLLSLAVGAAVVYGLHAPWTSVAAPLVRTVDPQPEMYRWVRDHVPPGEAVVSFDPAALFVYTARRSPDISVTTMGSRELDALLRTRRAEWLVDDSRIRESSTVVGPVLISDPKLLQLEFQTGPYRVYRVRSDKGER